MPAPQFTRERAMSDQRNLLQESLATIQRLRARLAASEAGSREPIAIIGAGCRYPGEVKNVDDLWRLVRDGVDAVSEVPADRWDVDAYYDPDPAAPNKMVTRRAGFIGRVDRFDPTFFGISPREAQTMDPQQRLLLETAYEAMESAGLAIEQLAGSATGVFIGITTSDYARLLLGGTENSDVYSATGGALNAAAGRISFTFGFQGPCVALDTACSSSLVATHLACQSLRTGESDLALAGGVNVILSPDAMVLFSKWGMMAPDGACKTFDADADGFVRAEGCAVIALKRLSDALAGGDPILAVIRGSAVNSDGRSSGLTVPNGPAQEAVVRKALASAGLKAADIDYVEAHGTGTPLGDPIEVEALGAALGAGRHAGAPLRIGSVKTNLGHTEAASGLAGLLKTVMALHHETLPPSLHFSKPNPRIDWERLPVVVQTMSTAWPRSERVRRAGVSSFGFSGTNAHVILEEAPARTAAPEARAGAVLLPLSARSEQALRDLAGRYADVIDARDVDLAALAAAAGTGRSHMTRRAAVTGESAGELVATLRALATGDTPPDAVLGTIRAGERPKIGFLFTGQGAQYAGMGRTLYDREPIFRAVIDRAHTVLAGRLERPLTEVLFGRDDAALSQTAYTQPALFALEYALAEQWRAWGVVPAIVLGHSVGEYAAACVAGVFDFESGLDLIAARGRAMQDLPQGGAMAAVFATAERVAAEVAPYADRLSVAGLNGPEETVIAGTAEAVGAVLSALAAQGIDGRRLDVSHAFHSPLLEPMLNAFEARAAGLTYDVPKIPLISNVSGEAFRRGEAPDAAYWRRHAREPVRFAQGLDALQQAGVTALVEIGPHPTLIALAGRAMPQASWPVLPSLRRGRDDQRQMLQALAGLYVRGQPVRWAAFEQGEPRSRVRLPTYPFQRERAWFDVKPAPLTTPAAATGHPLLGVQQLVEPPNATFVATISRNQPAFLAEHVVLGRTLFPGAAFIELALAAAHAQHPASDIRLRDFSIDSPLALPEDETQTLVTQVEVENGLARIRIRHAAETGWRDLARCKLGGNVKIAEAVTIAELLKNDLRHRDVGAYYARLEEIGLHYGPNFKALRELRSSPGIAVGRVELPADAPGRRDGYFMHPALLDAAFHVLGGALSDADPEGRNVVLPIGAEAIRWLRPAGPTAWVGVKLRASDDSEGIFGVDISIETGAGELVGSITGLAVRRAEREDLERALEGSGQKVQIYRRGWKEMNAPIGATVGSCLVVGSADGLGPVLVNALTAAGVAADFAPTADDGSFESVLAGAKTRPAWVIECGVVDAAGEHDVLDKAAVAYRHTLKLAQAMAKATPQAGLVLLTIGAQAVEPGDPCDPAQVAVLGLARTVEAERPQAPILRLDLDPWSPAPASQAAEVFRALAGTESEAAIRRGTIFVQRLEAPGPSHRTDKTRREVLRIETRGDLDNLRLVNERRRAPGRGEVEIEVRAAGLNFRDVLNTLGMYPGEAGLLGSEAAGIVAAVGEGVSNLSVGDQVLAFARDSIATYALAPASLTVKLPKSVDFADAVTIPNTYLTAGLSFSAAGGLKPGMRVLIHAAAGGVGLAALRLARLAGAEIFATAGSPAKRAFVLAEGATQVFDSRKAAFANAILEQTGGVDIVVNSLTGAFIPESFRALRQGGTFIEIGKAEILSEDRAASIRSDVRYRVIDLGEEIARDAEKVGLALAARLDDVVSGRAPSLPVQAFDLQDANAAFRYMASARHTGKIVLLPKRTPSVRADGTYLVTGGLGGLGLATARWLAAHGAGEIVLTARREPTDEQKAEVDALPASSLVRIARCDLSNVQAVKALTDELLNAEHSLRGIFHAAGVVDDATLEGQDEARYAKVAASKSDAAWRLSEQTWGAQLDFFVLFSSSSSVFGSPGQANYSASNAFLDGLASWRRAHGKVATSIAWGAWDEVGMAARLDERTRVRWAQVGIGLLRQRQALAAMEKVIEADFDQAAILALDADRFVRAANRYVVKLFENVVRLRASTVSEGTDEHGELLASDDPVCRQAAAAAYIRKEIARVLGFSEASLDENVSLLELGMDSLMAVQFRNAIGARLGLDVPLKRLLEGLTTAQLTAELSQAVAAPAPIEVGAEWEEGVL
jgi:acyl transferase domain-containing protein/NADPH:quinone reductase-like Zn-dependent oxidoreductase